MGGANGKQGAESGLSLASLTAVRYEPDIMTVRERMIEETSWDEFIRDKYGFQIFKKFLAEKGIAIYLEFWEIAINYRKRYDAIPSEELKILLHDPVINCFENGSLKEVLEVEDMDHIAKLLNPETKERLSLRLFDGVASAINEYLEHHQFFEWKYTDAIVGYFQNRFKLEEIVHDHHALFYLEKALAMEYSSENIDFLDATREYEMKHPRNKPDTNLKMAEKILHMYITQESPCQVNIPSKQREAIEEAVLKDKRAERGIFQMAQRETVLLMSRDGWPRYRRSRIFLQFLRSRRPVNKEQKLLSMEKAFKVRKGMFVDYIGSDSLNDVLDSMIGRDCLGKYLCILNPNDGSMNFLSDVASFRNANDKAQQQKIAQRIAATYFSPESTQEIKVSKSSMKSLVNVIDGAFVTPTLFDSACQEIRSKLKSKKHFEKFKTTGLYTKYRLMIRSCHSGGSSAY